MKLKYYLRGIGIGVIVTTLILMVSSVIHNNNLSEEKIIKEALKLGMIMPETTDEKDSLWVQSTEETDKSTEAVPESETEGDTQIPEEDTAITQEPRETVQFYIEIASTATLVSQNLCQAGLVDSAESFLSYLQEKDYTHSLRSGVFDIPKGASYEEICDIIMRRYE